jgi:SagB-type dehydrogenase family enzyme
VSEIEDRLLDAGDIEALALWHAVRPTLERDGQLCYRVICDDETLFSIVPGAPLLEAIEPSSGRSVRLSRFAYLRRDGEVFIIDSPRARGRVEVIGSRGVELIAFLASARNAVDLSAHFGSDATWVEPAIALLSAAGLVLATDDDGATTEDDNAHAAGWEFHDLVLHERSRTFRRDLRVGATYRLGRPAEAAIEPPDDPPHNRIALARADIQSLTEHDVPFTRVVESRRSVRYHASTPISVQTLGEFLFRTARAMPARLDDGGQHDARFRLYPGGGACHPLEMYVLVAHCAGLNPGLYHYLTPSHELLPIAADVDTVRALMQYSAVPMDDGSEQQVQIVFTARFERINRRYEGNAYALILQEVGALYQTMYLVATAMRLAPCAVGGGNADAFARLIGTDPLEEASVGAFVIGSR